MDSTKSEIQAITTTINFDSSEKELFNIAQFLNHAPSGIKLWNKRTKEYVTFICIEQKDNGSIPVIVTQDKDKQCVCFDRYGRQLSCFYGIIYDEDVDLFPDRSNLFWEHEKAPNIAAEIILPKCTGSVIVDGDGDSLLVGEEEFYFFNKKRDGAPYIAMCRFNHLNYDGARFATFEEAQDFVDKMNENGYDFKDGRVIEKKEEPVNYEKKYKEALCRANTFYKRWNSIGATDSELVLKEVKEIFQELRIAQESEDEEIRKWLINEIKIKHHNLDEENIEFVDKALAWLEKQGEQTHAELCQSEVTKTSDQELEPKFKVCDWISGYYTNYKVTAINSIGYVVEDTDGNKINILFKNEKFHHLWTIDDAKDGDVLCYHVSATNFFQIAIFKRVASKDELWGKTYRNYVQYGGFGGIENYTLQVALGDNELHHCGATACPATKEQRDLLFAEMKKAGYEWDNEKKELKKIEVKTLDPDKVIEWFRVNWWDSHIGDPIDKFKKDFGL